MPPPSTTIHATLDNVTVGPGPEWRHYLSAGRALLPSEAALASSLLPNDDAHTLVAGFAAEALLKALLAFSGENEKTLMRSHNLESLWSKAVNKNLLPTSAVPQWLAAVNVFHSKANDCFIRYKTGGGSYSLPAKHEVNTGLAALAAVIAAHVGKWVTKCGLTRRSTSLLSVARRCAIKPRSAG